jgi:hypothetical protein
MTAGWSRESGATTYANRPLRGLFFSPARQAIAAEFRPQPVQHALSRSRQALHGGRDQ